MSDLKKVNDGINLLKATFTKPKQIRDWTTVLTGLQAVAQMPTPAEIEQALLDVVKFRGQLNLNAMDYSLPTEMTPEDLLRIQAAQALVRWTGKKHLDAILALRDETANYSVINEVNQILVALAEKDKANAS